MITPPTGSPPHAWGRHSDGALDCQHARFTPTCVGKTKWEAEKRMLGSPPRVWGRQRLSAINFSRLRTTPTYVGKTTTNADVDTPTAEAHGFSRPASIMRAKRVPPHVLIIFLRDVYGNTCGHRALNAVWFYPSTTAVAEASGGIVVSAPDVPSTTSP